MQRGFHAWLATGRAVIALGIGATLLGCSERARVNPPPEAISAPQGAAAQSGEPRHVPVIRHGLPWYEDLPEPALAAARAQGKPVFVELWAPWCHTCLSMKNFVVTAANLPQVAEHFVLLSVDTERAENASFLSRFPVGVWPTFYVLPPDGTSVIGRWLGAAAPGQLVRFLSESERAIELSQARRLPPADPLALLVAADQLATRGDFLGAAEQYANALRAAPVDWPRRPETLVAQISALWKGSAPERCLTLAEAGLDQTGSSASAVDFAHYALECADRAPHAHPLALPVRRAVERRLSVLCQAGSAELSPDDRSDACGNLAAARTALKDAPGARGATLQRLEVLEAAAAGKPDDVAVTYDWARTDALLTLDRAEDALALAIARERALPRNYNPPHYQARSYKALGKWQEGLAALERALALAYGPRRIGLLTLKADLLFAAHRDAEALGVLREQLALYRALPEGQKQLAAERRVEERLKTATSSATGPGAAAP
jgi:tetratricopeptide (TPR) repeat protein